MPTLCICTHGYTTVLDSPKMHCIHLIYFTAVLQTEGLFKEMFTSITATLMPKNPTLNPFGFLMPEQSKLKHYSLSFLVDSQIKPKLVISISKKRTYLTPIAADKLGGESLYASACNPSSRICCNKCKRWKRPLVKEHR